MKTLIIVILCLFSFSVAFSPLYALELVKQDEKMIVRSMEGDFDGDGGIDIVTLKPKKIAAEEKWKEYIVNYDLEVKSKGKDILIKNILVDEVELFCGLEKIVVSPKIAPFIGISYATGAYSWMLELYSFDGKIIRKVDEFGSDGQSIQVKDVDKDGKNEIVLTERDWDHNSCEDHIIVTCKYDGKKWKVISEYETKTKKFIPIGKAKDMVERKIAPELQLKREDFDRQSYKDSLSLIKEVLNEYEKGKPYDPNLDRNYIGISNSLLRLQGNSLIKEEELLQLKLENARAKGANTAEIEKALRKIRQDIDKFLKVNKLAD